MASPLGHAAVGAATAAVVARSMDTPFTPLFWVGAVVASGIPDLDLILAWFGKTGPQYHRNASHSLFVLAAVVGGCWIVSETFLPSVSGGLLWGWSASLLTHPVLDVVTTGPKLAARGYGIGVFWPLSRHRFFVRRTIVDTPELEACRSFRELIVLLRPEVFTLGPPVFLILLAMILL